jgi:peptide/nickel transport system substrate-binding protein
MASIIVLAGCAQPSAAPSATGPSAQGDAEQPRAERTLVLAMRVEPASITSRPLGSPGVKVKLAARLFTAGLDINDDRGIARPYLAEALPQLNTDSWQVFANGTMETRYRLKPNLVWHDGAPLTAADFVFSWKAYTTPEITPASAPPAGLMEEASAPDDRTLVIRWSRIYPGAGALQSSQGNASDFPPIPRHVLGAAYGEANWDAFMAHPYWTRGYLGAGPYKLDRWEPGAFIEGSIFDRHIGGRPKIPRVQIRFLGDANTTLANLLSGAIHMAADDGIGFQQAVIAKKEWAKNNGGSIVVTADVWRAVYTQFRPETVTPPALLDVRVRRALAHSTDKQAVADTVYEGEGLVTEAPFAPSADFYPVIDGAAMKYPYDLRRSEQLMTDAGYTRGADGVYAGPSEGRVVIDLRINQFVAYEKERALMASLWRQAGFDIQESFLSAAQAQDGQARASFPGLYTFSTGQGDGALRSLATSQIIRPETRWSGTNRGGWSNPEYDRILDVFNTTLERDQRIQQMAQLIRILSEQLPAISLYYDLSPIAYVSALTGPGPVAPDASGLVGWNVVDWELR